MSGFKWLKNIFTFYFQCLDCQQQMVNTQEASGKEDDPYDCKAFLTVWASKNEELIV